MEPDSISIGDLRVTAVVIFSERGYFDLTTSFSAMSIYESIFTPGIICDIEILDTNDSLGLIKLLGDETVVIKAHNPGEAEQTFVFHAYALVDLQNVGAQKAKSYTLQCASKETMRANNLVCKGYKDLHSNIVKDIHKNYLKSEKPLTVENTLGKQHINIPNIKPYQAINMIKEKSVSPENKSSLFVYFEYRDSGEQKFKFTTIESLFREKPIKSFIQTDVINSDYKNLQDNNILSFNIPQQFSSIDKILLSGPRRVQINNLTTQEYENRIITPNEETFIDGGNGAITSQRFREEFLTINPPAHHVVRDISHRPMDYAPDYRPDQQIYTALLLQNSMKIRVPGDLNLTAGSMINCSILDKQSFTTGPVNDPLMSGKFLIARIHHRVGFLKERPRYTCVIECVKGKFNEGINTNVG